MTMKKFVLFIMITVLSTTLFAQKSAIQTASNYQKQGKLDKAKEYIDKACKHEKTIANPQAWYYKGNIYIDIYQSPLDAFKDLAPDALIVAHEAYNKALELDIKKRYTDDILNGMPGLGELFFNDGARHYNTGIEAQNVEDSVASVAAFTKSMESFETAYNIYNKAEINDTLTVYYISVAAELAGNYTKAKETLLKLMEMNYPKAAIYSSLAGIYYNEDKDLDKAIATYQEGRDKYPGDLNLLLMETNLFLGEGMTEEALGNLQQAAKIDTTNPTIFFAIGAKYNEVVDDTTKTDEMRNDAFEKAIIAYEKSIELKDDYFDPNYNLGALYVNKASNIISVAILLDISEQEKYDEMMAEANKYLELSLPYLERAHELDPEDKSTMVSLKEIYTRLNMNEKRLEIDAKLNSN